MAAFKHPIVVSKFRLQPITAGMQRELTPATGSYVTRRLNPGIVGMTSLCKFSTIKRDVVVIGASAGGLEVIKILLHGLPKTLMVIIAQCPADQEHPYGHHKAEYFSSGFEGILIVGVAIGQAFHLFGGRVRARCRMPRRASDWS